MRTISFITTGLVFIAVTALAQTARESRMTTAVAPEATETARLALGTFAALVNEQNYEGMGFTSPAEVRQARLGTPFVTFMIRLDELQRHQGGMDPLSLLRPTQQVMFPVEVGGRVASSIEVAQRESKWAAVSFGGPNRIRSLSTARARLTAEMQIAPEATAQIEIPALRMVFVGAMKGDQLVLVPVLDYPSVGLRSGVAVPAEEILPRIAEFSRDKTFDAPA